TRTHLLKRRPAELTNPHVLALVCNALLAVGARDSEVAPYLDRLEGLRQAADDGKVVWWGLPGQAPAAFYGDGPRGRRRDDGPGGAGVGEGGAVAGPDGTGVGVAGEQEGRPGHLALDAGDGACAAGPLEHRGQAGRRRARAAHHDHPRRRDEARAGHPGG